jgi:hypothetical protein
VLISGDTVNVLALHQFSGLPQTIPLVQVNEFETRRPLIIQQIRKALAERSRCLILCYFTRAPIEPCLQELAREKVIRGYKCWKLNEASLVGAIVSQESQLPWLLQRPPPELKWGTASSDFGEGRLIVSGPGVR